MRRQCGVILAFIRGDRSTGGPSSGFRLEAGRGVRGSVLGIRGMRGAVPSVGSRASGWGEGSATPRSGMHRARGRAPVGRCASPRGRCKPCETHGIERQCNGGGMGTNGGIPILRCGQLQIPRYSAAAYSRYGTETRFKTILYVPRDVSGAPKIGIVH